MRGRKSARTQRFVSRLFPMCRSPQSQLALAKSLSRTVEGAVQKRYSSSCSICRAGRLQRRLISYSLIALSSCKLLSSPKQGKDGSFLSSFLCNIWAPRELALPRQELRSDRSHPGTGCSLCPALWMHPRGFSILAVALVPPTAVILALIQAVGLSNEDNPVHSSLLPHC